MTVTLKCAEHCDVVLISKGDEFDSNSSLAQGGIAVVLDPEDSVDSHVTDTLDTGVGLSNRAAVETLVREGPARVRELLQLGVDFDRDDGQLAFAREGGHSRRRIVHVGDSTGREVVRVLLREVLARPRVTFLRGWRVVELLVSEGECHGAVAVSRDGEAKVFISEATVLATGGVGQLYSVTTNSYVATGDGIALALRGGAEIADMEFIQFHPTALYGEEGAEPAFLISEAVRGEGAYLLNAKGERFMSKYHHMGELAPRDVVARAIVAEAERTNSDHVFLDMRHFEQGFFRKRFPEIFSGCKKRGIDVTRDLVPVMPAAHYLMGGVRVDLDSESTVKRLFVCGESSCTGVHGANRLASNSLLEALVYGTRAAKAALGRYVEARNDRPRDKVMSGSPSDNTVREAVDRWGRVNRRRLRHREELAAIRRGLKGAMMEHAGLVRTAFGLSELRRTISQLKARLARLKLSVLQPHELRNREAEGTADPDILELENELEVGDLIARFAQVREESRGGHYRADFPETSERWSFHISYAGGRMREVRQWE